jgi:hypothetical protein
MKQKDMLLIIVVAVISVIFSLVVSNLIFGSPSARVQKAEVVDPISSEFTTPDQRYFNQSAVDPTAIIRIGDTTNSSPFGE